MFDRNLYNKYDLAGKQMLWNILNAYGYTLVNDLNAEYYKDSDLITISPTSNKEVKWEIEVKNDNHFDKAAKKQYRTIIINYRKKDNNSNYYCIFNQSFTSLLLCTLKNIKSSQTKQIKTNRGDEIVFDVDRRLWKLYNINKDTHKLTLVG
jgi:hypothetical protein